MPWVKNNLSLQDERDEDLGVFDANARMYDPLVPRFWSQDVLSELSHRFSPYVYTYSNPVNFIDLDGMAGRKINDFDRNELISQDFSMKQHYIPRVYLKQFESGRKKLYSLHNKAHKFSPHIKEQTKAQLGYLHDFYTIKNKNILNRLELSDKDIIEKVFNARVENRFEKILASLLSPLKTLSLPDAEEVLIMLLSMKERNPMFRRVFENPQTIIEAFNRRFDEVFEHRETLERILKLEGRTSFNEFVEYGHNYAHQFAHDLNTPQDLHTEGIVKLYRNEKTFTKDIVSWLLGCEWYILETTL